MSMLTEYVDNGKGLRMYSGLGFHLATQHKRHSVLFTGYKK